MNNDPEINPENKSIFNYNINLRNKPKILFIPNINYNYHPNPTLFL